MTWFQEVYAKATRWLDEHSGFGLYSAVLLFAMIAAYDSQIWRQGTYYDDWEGIFLYKQGFSPLQVWNYFLNDRPFSFLVHIIYNPIIGSSAFGWHVLGLLLNWAAVVLLVRTLLRLWPGRVMEAGWIGLLVGLFPGMHRQFVVHTSMPHYTSMLLFTLSLLLMVKSYQDTAHRRLLLTISVVLAGLQVLIIEYFAALELVRLLLLFYILRDISDTWRQAVARTLRAWLPYAFVFIGFLVFHFAILPVIQRQGVLPKHPLTIFAQLSQHPLATIQQYAQNVVQDIVYVILYAWSLPWVPQDLNFDARAVVASWVLGLAVASLAAWFMWSWHKKVGTAQEPRMPALLLVLCVSALLLGGLPAWIIGDQAVKGTWADRFLFGQVLGAVPIAVVTLAWLLGQGRKYSLNLILAILLAGSISLQFRVGNQYAILWDRTRSYYWQLKWRAPSLQPGAFLVTTSTPVGGTDSYQNALVMNTAFNAGYGKEAAQYWWFSGPEDLYAPAVGKYRPAMKINLTFRSLSFSSDMLHALPVIQDKSGGRCLQVLDPVYQGEPLLNPDEQNLFSIAHDNMILLKEKPLPQDVFGPEPDHNWCYYYQRADLARQFGQWDQVLELWRQAGPLTATFLYGPEYLPFIEAFARNGEWDQAAELTREANTRTVDMASFLCGSWTRITKATPASDLKTATWSKLQSELACTQPQEVP